MNASSLKALRRAACVTVETLEGRRMLSTTTITPNGDGTNTLFVKGTDGKDNIYIFHNQDLNFVEIVDDKNGNKIADGNELDLIDDADLSVIRVDAKKGNDHVEVHGLSDYFGASLSIEVDLGDGNDSVLVTTNPAKDVNLGLESQANGADILKGSDINIDLEGEGGKDTFDLDFSRTSILASGVSVQLDAGSSDDTVNLELPDAADGESIGGAFLMLPADPHVIDDGTEDLAATLQIDLDLGSGNDTINQNVNTVIVNDSAVGIVVDGGSGKDKYYDYENFAVENGSSFVVNANLGSGDDRYKGEYNFKSIPIDSTLGANGADPVTEGGIDIDQSSTASFTFQGSDGNDKLEVDHLDEVAVGGIPITKSSIDGVLTFQLYGGRGNDLAEIDLHPGDVTSVGITGIFRGLVSGDDGDDHARIDILAGGEGGQYDLQVLGGSGYDKLGAAFQDDSFFGVSYGPRQHILVDGGRNTDKYDTEGNGIFGLRSVETLDDTLENPFL